MDFSPFSQEQIDLMMSHINSYKRKDLGDKSPYDLVLFMYGEEILRKLSIIHVDPDNVCLQPSLLTR